MTERFSNFPESNPFSTRFTAPGKTPFFFERSFLRRMKAARPAKFEEFFVRALGAGEDIRASVCLQFLVDQFETHSRRGQIVGQHGSGKSTLLLALKDALTRSGYEIFSWSLHDRRRFLPDVFWLELQQFLQTAPAFLPVKCLLPPPVVSREEYLAQQRDSLRDDEDEHFDEITTIEQFCVADPVNKEGGEPSDAEKSQKKKAFFGFNEAGNFGLNATRAVDASRITAAGAEETAFAPFPGVAPPVDSKPSDGSAPKSVDSDSAVASENAFKEVEQKKLEIPLPVDYDFNKNRSFFEKKIVFFDGFEQLSYVNRIVLRTFCRMNRLGLLLTTHSPAIGIPVLFRTNPSVEILRQVMNFLLDDLDMTPDDSDLEILLKNFEGDIRKILFSLYDAYENYRWAPGELRKKIIRRYPR